MRRMPRLRRLVAASPALRQLRPCRLLRLVPVTAREPPRRRHRTPRRSELRARRGLVLGLRGRAVPRRAGPGPAPASPPRTACAGTRRPGPPGLAATPALDLPSSGGLARVFLYERRIPANPPLALRRSALSRARPPADRRAHRGEPSLRKQARPRWHRPCLASWGAQDRKSTRLNSSHSQISYAVFCLKK